MNVIFWKQNDLIDATIIDQFEKQEKIKLPQDYKQFLLETNGGRVYGSLEYIDKFHGLTNLGVDTFYGFSGENDDIRSVRKRLKRSFPRDLLAIGGDIGGHITICLNIRDEKGKVYLFDDRRTLVADNFTNFVNQIEFHVELTQRAKRVYQAVDEEVLRQGGREKISSDEYNRLVREMYHLIEAQEYSDNTPQDKDK